MTPICTEKNMKVAGMFAGIGGFELGLKESNYQTDVLCEIDPAAKAVLSKRFSDTEIISDVREIDSLNVDILTAGFPCQDLSSVGKKEGINGSKSSVVEEVFRILAKRPVEWVIIENVKFMLHLKKGRAIKAIIEGLERLGYNWAYRVLTTQAFGLPQRRHRVFFVASLSHDPRQVLLSEDFGQPSEPKPTTDHPLGFYWTEGTYAVGLALNAFPPLKGGSTIGIPSPPAILFPNGLVATPDIRDAERLQGFPSGWTKPAEEIARPSVRWRLVGNAVSVPVASWLGNKLRNPMPYDNRADVPINGKWPTAAWGIKGKRYISNASDWPIKTTSKNLSSFLNYTPKPLSVKASKGFLNRANKGNLNFPIGFLEMIENHYSTLEAVSLS